MGRCPSKTVGSAKTTDTWDVRTGTASTVYRFAGQQDDADLGFIYLRARYYDPTTGRFIGKDPFPGVLTIPASQHPYSYAWNNPTNWSDPSGEFPPIIAAVAVGTVVGAGVGGVAAWISGEDVLQGAAKGALVGGVGVLGGAAGLAVAGSIGITGTAAAVVAGATSGAVADAASQGIEIALGSRAYYDSSQTVGAAAIGAFTGGWYGRGWELDFGNTRFGLNCRLAPFGNRTNHPTGELPHYHRGRPNPNQPGHSLPNQGASRHRPWDKRPSDNSLWDRF